MKKIRNPDYWCQKLDRELDSAKFRVEVLLIGYQDLASRANARFNAMDFKFLFDEQRQVFHIGYNMTTERLDGSYYDLLASEARLASLIAIAKGDVPQSHWMRLGRPVTRIGNKQVLLSWSGTMFEYLMPLLIAKNYEETFLYDSTHAALEAQIHYTKSKNMPWGISESGYYAFDVNMNYQYRAFGVPSLGYKRDLPDDLVIAPYASVLGLGLQPHAVVENIEHFEKLNVMGRFGLYEALDYTKSRLTAGQVFAVVQSYMAHHQGMVLLAASNYLLKNLRLNASIWMSVFKVSNCCCKRKFRRICTSNTHIRKKPSAPILPSVPSILRPGWFLLMVPFRRYTFWRRENIA